jgi:hypothetical protein
MSMGNMYYLTIEGGKGHGEPYMGGTYKFVGGYFNQTEISKRNGQSLEKWCEETGLPYFTGETFEELVAKLELIKYR